MRRSRYFGAALFGLLVVAAISVAAGSGRKPAMELGATTSLRRLSASEVADIIRRFPGIVPSYIDPRKYDSEQLARIFRFSEVTVGTLSDVFPAARFYKGLDFDRPPIPYLMAVVGDKYCMPPEGFNRLLSYVGLKVNDKNILPLAKAFVALAVGSRKVFGNPWMDLLQGRSGGDELLAFPDVTFGESKRISELRGGATYDARLKVKVDGRDEEWWFDVKYGQFALVSRGDDKGLILQYYPKIIEPIQTQGRLGSAPKIVILSDPNIYGEAEARGPDTIPHYYATVDRNSSPTNVEVIFSLTGFPPNARNVYVRVRDTIWVFRGHHT
jgi:hypothetical protein